MRVVRGDDQTRQRWQSRLSARSDGDEQQDLFLYRTPGRKKTNSASRQHIEEVAIFDNEISNVMLATHVDLDHDLSSHVVPRRHSFLA